MVTLTIERDIVTLMDDASHGFTNRTNLFFGNAVAMLEAEFPTVASAGADAIAANIIGSISETLQPIDIWGFREYGNALFDIQQFIGGRTSFAPSLQEMERLRIHLCVKSAPMPTSIFDENAGMCFEQLHSVSAVLWAVMYYHAFHGQKLVRCKHCGRWFATDSLKDEYCIRTSPCFGSIVKGKAPLTCKQATDQIKQKCSYLRNSIASKAIQSRSDQLQGFGFLRNFYEEADRMKDAVREHPTPENLGVYYNFLRDTNKSRAWLVRGENNVKT